MHVTDTWALSIYAVVC